MKSEEIPLVARTIAVVFSRKLFSIYQEFSLINALKAFLQSPFQTTSLPANILKCWIRIKSKKDSLSALILIKQLLTLQVSRTVLPLALGLEGCKKGLKDWDQNNCIPTGLKIFGRMNLWGWGRTFQSLPLHVQTCADPRPKQFSFFFVKMEKKPQTNKPPKQTKQLKGIVIVEEVLKTVKKCKIAQGY